MERRARDILVVHARHVAIHARERIDCGGCRVSGVGLHAGGDPAVRRRVHGGVCAAAAGTSGGRSSGACAANPAVKATAELAELAELAEKNH